MAELTPEMQKTIEFNDKYFPQVDIRNRAKYTPLYKFGDRSFVYDKENSLVISVFKDKEELEILGKDTPWRDLDSVGLSFKNWQDKEARDEYLTAYTDDLDAECSYLANDFIKNELPMYQQNKDSKSVTEATGDETKKGLNIKDLESNTNKSWFDSLPDEAKKMILLVDTGAIDINNLIEMICDYLDADQIYKMFKDFGRIDLDEYEVVQ